MKKYVLKGKGVDATVCWQRVKAGYECWVLQAGSKMSKPSRRFVSDRNHFVSDYRRLGIEAGHEENETALIPVSFLSLRQAAQFVLADLGATRYAWRRVSSPGE